MLHDPALERAAGKPYLVPDRVVPSPELARDAIASGYIQPWVKENAKRSDDRKPYPADRKDAHLKKRAPRLSGQILLFPEMKPVARLQSFGGGIVPGAVTAEIGFRRKQLGQRELAKLIGRSQGQLANALRGHDPMSAASVNRLRDALLRTAA